MLYFVLNFITPAVHGHGRGTRLGTCLVQQLCISCVVAFVACSNVSMSWLGAGMHEACGSAHGQCTLRVPWPLLRASLVLDAVAQSRYMHTHRTHSCDIK